MTKMTITTKSVRFCLCHSGFYHQKVQECNILFICSSGFYDQNDLKTKSDCFCLCDVGYYYQDD